MSERIRSGGEERYPCPFCDRTYLNADTIIGHCKRDHFPELDSAEAIYGKVCPACGESFEGLARHSSATHGRQLSQLFAEARQTGDPHGVVHDRLDRFAALFQRWLDARRAGPAAKG